MSKVKLLYEKVYNKMLNLLPFLYTCALIITFVFKNKTLLQYISIAMFFFNFLACYSTLDSLYKNKYYMKQIDKYINKHTMSKGKRVLVLSLYFDIDDGKSKSRTNDIKYKNIKSIIFAFIGSIFLILICYLLGNKMNKDEFLNVYSYSSLILLLSDLKLKEKVNKNVKDILSKEVRN